MTEQSTQRAEPVAWYMHLWNEADEDVKSEVRWGQPSVDDIERAEHNGHDIEHLYAGSAPAAPAMTEQNKQTIQPFAWYWYDQHGCLYITGDDRKPDLPADAQPLYATEQNKQSDTPAPSQRSEPADLPVLMKASLPTTSCLSQLEARKSCAASVNDPLKPASPPPQAHLLGPKHTGMKVDYRGLLASARRSMPRDPGTAEMLRQFEEHLTELGQRWYAGDAAVVDEILQLYCIEREARAALATTKGQP